MDEIIKCLEFALKMLQSKKKEGINEVRMAEC